MYIRSGLLDHMSVAIKMVTYEEELKLLTEKITAMNKVQQHIQQHHQKSHQPPSRTCPARGGDRGGRGGGPPAAHPATVPEKSTAPK